MLLLDLGGNLFGSQIPSLIGSLKNLMYSFNLSNNGLTGQLPFELASMTKLKWLYISYNNLTGSLNVLGQLSSSLMELDISENLFTCPVPQTLMNLLNPSAFIGNPEKCIELEATNNLDELFHHLERSA